MTSFILYGTDESPLEDPCETHNQLLHTKSPSRESYSRSDDYDDETHFTPNSTTIDSFERRKLLDRLRSLMQSADFGRFLAGRDTCVKMRAESVEQACYLLGTLPDAIPVPSILPDEEGDVEFYWPDTGGAVVTVEDGMLHALFKPDSDGSLHIDDLSLKKNKWPFEILSRLPLR